MIYVPVFSPSSDAVARSQTSTTPWRIVIDGDSVSKGAGASAEMTPDKQICSILGESVEVENIGVNGFQVLKTLERYQSVVAPLFNPEAPFNFILYHAGDNDIYVKKSSQETYENFSRYVALAHAQGWKVIVSTEIERFDWPAEPQQELREYNRLLLANSAHADAVVDLNALPGMAGPASRANPAYFHPDGIHPSDGGYALIVQLYVDAMNDLVILQLSASS